MANGGGLGPHVNDDLRVVQIILEPETPPEAIGMNTCLQRSWS